MNSCTIINYSRTSEFNDMVNYCALIDMGFKGNRFTWLNKHFKQKKADRFFFANNDWLLKYPNAHVWYLPRTHSDHCPHPLHLFCDDPHLKKMFKFETMWSFLMKFLHVIRFAWTNSESLPHAVTTFEKSATIWANQNFENVYRKKRNILNRIEGIHNSPNYFNSFFLQNLEKQLNDGFNLIFKTKEDHWKLKSRINWLNHGDDNTKFFHTSVLIRRRKNHIVRLTLNDNSEVRDQRGIIDHTKSYFQTLFSTSHHKSLVLSIPYSRTHLSDSNSEDLKRNPTDSEIKNTIFSFQPFKASGPDGFHPYFFQHY